MELAGNIVVHLELNSSSDDFFKAWSREAHKIPGKATNQIKQVDLHEGDWEGTGSIKQWVYTIDGKEEIFKEKVHIDDENKTDTMYCVEGHCLELYKTYSLVYYVFQRKSM